MDIEKLVGMHIDDAEEILKKEKLEYKIIKKVNLFKKKNYVYDVKEVEKTSGGGHF